jgi:hypothetical protein
MGTYVYNMRKKTLPIIVNGTRFSANYFSYSYKPIWSLFDNCQSRIKERTERVGRNAFDSERSGYVIVGDTDNYLSGAPVYVDVTSAIWYDNGDFPGRQIGYIHKEGRNWVVRKEEPWSEVQRLNNTGNWDKVKVRCVLQTDGTLTEEVVH